MLFFHRLLRAHIIGRPAAKLKFGLVGIFNFNAKPKVYDLGLLGLPVNQNVVQFKVSMDDAHLMHVNNGLNHLREYLLHFVLLVNPLRREFPYVLVKVVSIDVLHNY